MKPSSCSSIFPNLVSPSDQICSCFPLILHLSALLLQDGEALRTRTESVPLRCFRPVTVRCAGGDVMGPVGLCPWRCAHESETEETPSLRLPCTQTLPGSGPPLGAPLDKRWWAFRGPVLQVLQPGSLLAWEIIRRLVFLLC